jgi:ABC-type glycerol-3-phosphate transport system permease component
MLNSAIIASGTTLVVLLLGTPAAYSLARFEFLMRSRDIALWLLVKCTTAICAFRHNIFAAIRLGLKVHLRYTHLLRTQIIRPISSSPQRRLC